MTVTYDGGAKASVKTGPKTQVAFEREFNLGLLEAFQSEGKMRFEWLYFLAWHASKTASKTQLDFDDWLGTVDTIDVEGDEPVDPSVSAPSTTTSLVSPT